MVRYLIFSDLDGTLLDHHSYSWAPAQAALDRIAQLQIPLILNSSKTFAEIVDLRARLHNRHPFLVENGSALYLPEGYFTDTGNSAGAGFERQLFALGRQRILFEIDALRRRHGFRFRGFDDMSVEELAQCTGLSPAAARRAKQRDCSEPILWQGDQPSLRRFDSELARHGMRLLAGGRFLHVMGETDKAAGMRWLVERYRGCWPQQEIVSIALGDSPNDLAMLRAADIPVVIPAVDAEPLRLPPSSATVYPDLPGPAGWQQAIDKILGEEATDG